jgi:hypothetical protein
VKEKHNNNIMKKNTIMATRKNNTKHQHEGKHESNIMKKQE